MTTKELSAKLTVMNIRHVPMIDDGKHAESWTGLSVDAWQPWANNDAQQGVTLRTEDGAVTIINQ